MNFKITWVKEEIWGNQTVEITKFRFNNNKNKTEFVGTCKVIVIAIALNAYIE